MPDGVIVAIGALFLMTLTALITGTITHENDLHTAFKLKCEQSNGTVTETRDTDFCFKGNVLLFKKNF